MEKKAKAGERTSSAPQSRIMPKKISKRTGRVEKHRHEGDAKNEVVLRHSQRLLPARLGIEYR